MYLPYATQCNNTALMLFVCVLSTVGGVVLRINEKCSEVNI